MLNRQRIILALLAQAPGPLSRTRLVKLLFLIRHETPLAHLPSFYDFVPYKDGPFSFALYRDMQILKESGYIQTDSQVALSIQNLNKVRHEIDRLPSTIICAITCLIDKYGKTSQDALVEMVYHKYPWFTLNSELVEHNVDAINYVPETQPAIYTAGYEGRSIDSFLNNILKHGIKNVIDVRANPISRKYGFAKSQLRHLCGKLDLGYHPVPSLGIPSKNRVGLGDHVSYQCLLDWYEHSMLPSRLDEVAALGYHMGETPSALVCFEEDVECCHRSRLAKAVANASSLEVTHL